MGVDERHAIDVMIELQIVQLVPGSVAHGDRLFVLAFQQRRQRLAVGGELNQPD